MKRKLIVSGIILIAFSNAFADDPQTIKGAEQYDWQTCVNDKSSGCLNACATSEDINCSESCKNEAADKCKAQGISPPNW